MPRLRLAAIAGAILVPVIAGGFILQERGAHDGPRLLGQVLDLVGSRFVDTVDTGDLYEKAARGLVTQLQDPYSELMSPAQLKSFNTTTGGKYGGIGMQIEDQKEKGITVSRVFPHTPAEAAGIREGDLISVVESTSTKGWTTRKVSDALTGTPGTKVNVAFSRPGVPQFIRVTFTRAVIRIPAVPYAIMLESKIGYVPLQQFSESATEEVAAGIRRLTTEGAKSIILDLRTNPGGYLEQALAVSNLFLNPGQEILSVRGRNQTPQVYVARERPLAPTVPLVILTDQYSASASEIVAGALQDHDRALIIGNTSFGKGLVQTVYDLDGGYALKLTTAKWYTPVGRSIQKERKLMPDGSFVEVHPDSLESDSARKARPQFHSDAGRLVYGGGAITPDLIVKADTLTVAERDFLKAIAPKSQELYVALYDYAYQLKNGLSPMFPVDPSWREEFYRRIQKAGVGVEKKQYDAAGRYVDRLIENQVARLAFGDSTAKRHALSDDAQLAAAIDILKKGQSQKDLFALVTRAPMK